jgi:hypothetical protein
LTNNCTYSATAQFVITGNAPSIGVSRVGSSSPTLVANPAASADFAITAGPPTPSSLPAAGSITYPVMVTSIGNQSGYVNLALAPSGGTSMPNAT